MTKLCVGRWKFMKQKWLVCAALANVEQFASKYDTNEMRSHVVHCWRGAIRRFKMCDELNKNLNRLEFEWQCN